MKTLRIAAMLALIALVAAVIAVWRKPDLLIDADFTRQRLMVGLSQATVQIDDHRWTYAYSDDAPAAAPTIVMLHGFTGSKENWYPLARQLRGRYRLVIPDLPGWGASQRIAGSDYGYVTQAARVARFLGTVVGRGRPVVLLGHSMGGGIAAMIAARYPQDVARVGLLAAGGVRFKDNRFGHEVLDGRNPFEVTDAATLQRYLDILFVDGRVKPWMPWPGGNIYITRRRHDATHEQAVLDRIGRGPDSLLPGVEAAHIRQSALLLWCRQDAVIDASALELYAAQIPHAQKVLLEGCGHMSLMEQPAAVASAVNALIKGEGP